MDPRVMELRIKKWIPVIEEQAKSGMSKKEWCVMHGINRETVKNLVSIEEISFLT